MMIHLHRDSVILVFDNPQHVRSGVTTIRQCRQDESYISYGCNNNTCDETGRHNKNRTDNHQNDPDQTKENSKEKSLLTDILLSCVEPCIQNRLKDVKFDVPDPDHQHDQRKTAQK